MRGNLPFSLFDFAEIKRTSESLPQVNFWYISFSNFHFCMNPAEKDAQISLTLFWSLVQDYPLPEEEDWSSSIPSHLSMIRRDHCNGQLILWAVWRREETSMTIVSCWVWNFLLPAKVCGVYAYNVPNAKVATRLYQREVRYCWALRLSTVM